MDQPLSIKQQREQKRQAKLEARTQQSSQRQTRRWILWGGSAVGLALTVWGLWFLAQPAPGDDAGLTTVGIQADDHVRGNRDAAAVLIEYSDFQCPACKNAQPLVEQVIERYGDRLAFVYRHYPLRQIHKNAQAAAEAAEAAELQNQFWAYHDLLFAQQATWALESDPRESFIAYAKQLGLDTNKFSDDLGLADAKSKIQTDISRGDASRVPGTPTFFLNGRQVTPIDLDDLTTAIDAVLAGS